MKLTKWLDQFGLSCVKSCSLNQYHSLNQTMLDNQRYTSVLVDNNILKIDIQDIDKEHIHNIR